jgi:RNA polymerase sigma-70 factor (ECF subfamily)
MTDDHAARQEDRDIAARIAVGDESAFGLAYDRNAGLLFGSIVRFLGNHEMASEIVQDAFVALWRRAGQDHARAGSLQGWWLAIARNRASARLRGEARRPVIAGELTPDVGRSEPASTDPAAIADRRWVQSVIRTVIADLPQPEQDVLVLAYAGDLSQVEIARRLDVPIGTVKSRTRRAMARLRSRLVEVPGLLDAEAVGRATSASYLGTDR